MHTRVRATAAALQSPPATVLAHAHATQRPSVVARRDVPVLLRLPILIPMSFAAGMLLVVGTHTWLTPSQPRVLVRAVQMQRTLRPAPVHAEPSTQAQILTRLNAGETVEIHAEQSGWCRIALPDGGEGWIERRAFE